MKRILATVCMLLLLTVAMASCDLLHEHSFSEEWKSDSDYHWNPCTVNETCTEQGNRAAHEFESDIDEDGKPLNTCKVCGYQNYRVSTAPEHEHTFGTEYHSSENFHWFECTTEGCFEASKNDEHQYGNPEITYSDTKLTTTYVCVDCGYKKVETQTVEAEVDSAVEWDEIFGNFNLTNFSMYVYITDGEYTQTNHCIVTEYGIYYCIEDYIEFYVIKEDGQWVGYQKLYDDEDKKFKVLDISQEELQELYENLSREAVLQISFAENFDKFTYDADTGSYTSNQTITADSYDNDGDYLGELYCVNSVVNVVDGEIMYISSNYYFDEVSESDGHRFIYENIGHAELKVPQAVIDEANANVDAE